MTRPPSPPDAEHGAQAWPSPIRLRPSQLVARPWGGDRLAALTGLEAPEGQRVGEAFQVAAWPQDHEAHTFPSLAESADGTTVPLPALLAEAGARILGDEHMRRFGPRWPLLPKLLDVGELLSVQAHPPGQPEVYLILQAEPGATVALGFRRDLDRDALHRALSDARALQDHLAESLLPRVGEGALQPLLGPWLATPGRSALELLPEITPLLAPVPDTQALCAQLERLRSIHRDLLDAMHHIPVAPGMVLYNRQLGVPDAGRLPSAEVHALGNPEGRGVVMMEIRLPGTTLRAWDHARFPRRRLDLEAALAALPLSASPAGFFEIEPQPRAPGVFRSLATPLFVLDHLRPGTVASLAMPALAGASTLHALRGFAQLYDTRGQLLQELMPGDTLLVPAGLATTLRSQIRATEILHVTIPPENAPCTSSPDVVGTEVAAMSRGEAVGSIAAQPDGRRSVRLKFGTSGLRGLVVDMTDREVYLATAGFLRFLEGSGDLPPGAPLAIGEDLRARCTASGMESSPRIARAVAQACAHAGHPVIHCGQLPTPALAYWASLDEPSVGKRPMPAIMITGSHIPSDRNGVKFYKLRGEVLKSDEPAILTAVQAARDRLDATAPADDPFDAAGAFQVLAPSLPTTLAARRAYTQRYLDCFGRDRPLAGRKLVFFEHSAVGRDLLVSLFEALGAEVIRIGRTDGFVAIDTEDLGAEALARFQAMVREHRPFALVSTDGDSDRPLLIDERGQFHRGDMLGLITALHVGARAAAVPVSTNDAVDLHLAALALAGGPTVDLVKTRIGSPWVIAAMQRAEARGQHPVAGWEANGGFLLGSDVPLGAGLLRALPTRDAVLPLLAALVGAARRGVPVSQLFAELPQRAATAALIDGVPPATSRAMLARLSPPGDGPYATYAALVDAFAQVPGLGEISGLETMDGLRVHFSSGEIVHLRPSGNAPQLRCYAVADGRDRAQYLLDRVLRHDDSVVRRLMSALEAERA
jgi:phosphomannomutase